MAIRNGNKARKRGTRPPDLLVILGQFSDARSILECGVLLLEDWDQSRIEPADEAICLRHGLKLLSVAYDELDRAIIALKN